MIVVAGVVLMCSAFVFADNNSSVDMIPSNIVSMTQKGDVALIVEKSTQCLYLYCYNGQYNQEIKLKCSTGKLAGRKNKSGDQKTPEGVYFFTGKYFEKDLSPIYGTMAFPVDYPNQIDQEAGRTGYAIWLHGTDKKLKPMDSNGCVALENNDLEKIERRISLDYTPIIFLDKVEYINKSKHSGIETKIQTLLKDWKISLESGTYHKYLSSYSPDYVPDIRWWSRWQKIKKTDDIAFEVELITKSIYKDGDLYLVIIDEVLKYGTKQRHTGVKKLYIANENGDYKIRGEAYKSIHHLGNNTKKKNPLNSPLLVTAKMILEDVKLEKIEKTDDMIKRFVLGWVSSWSAGEIDEYSKFYSKDFYSSGMDKKNWVDKKTYLSKVYNYIDVTVSKLLIRHGEDRVFVSFQQNYKSSGYSAIGSKTLVLVNEDKQWKIIQEIWKKS